MVTPDEPRVRPSVPGGTAAQRPADTTPTDTDVTAGAPVDEQPHDGPLDDAVTARAGATARASDLAADTAGPGTDVDEPRPAVPEVTAPTSLRWRVPGGVVIAKVAATLGLMTIGLLLATDSVGLLLFGIASATIGLYALRDLLAPVRLVADVDGVTVVAGFAGRRTIAWREIERIRIDERTRFGIRMALLEIDTGDTLHLFSSSELGTPVEEAAEALRHLRTGR